MTGAGRDRLRDMLPDVAVAFIAEERLLDHSCAEFEEHGSAIGFQVDGFEGTLWLVPRVIDALHLADEGVPAGRIYTAREWFLLASLPHLSRDDFVRLALLKMAFGARIVEADRAPPERDMA